MSDENVDTIKRVLDAYMQGDYETSTAALDPEVEMWADPRAFPDAGPVRGREAVIAEGPVSGVYGRSEWEKETREFVKSWESVRLEPHEFIEVGDQVVVPWTMHGVARDGLEVVSRVTWTVTIRDGAIERLRMYQTREDALAAAGLSE